MMRTAIQDAKAALRREVTGRSNQLTIAQRAAAGAQARALLAQQRHWQQARAILFYAPMPEELDVWPLLIEALAAGRVVALPRFMPATRTYLACPVQDIARDVTVGYHGIREPVDRCAQASLDRADLILVPGVAFDLHGRRLGRGKGFYDQLLAGVRGRTCGVAFDEQIVPEVPFEPHDIRLNCVLTPTRWVEL